MENMSKQKGREKPVVFILFFVFVFSVIVFSGNISDGPRIVDEHQIFSFQIEFREFGLWKTLFSELHERSLSYKRLFPIHLIQNVLLSFSFGSNLSLWSLYTGLIAVLTMFVLFLFGREFRLPVIESVFFSALIMVGEQSVIWWKLIQGEGIGMLFLSATLLFLVKSTKKNEIINKNKYSVYFVIFAILASLSKESFILTLPALVLFRLWMSYREEERFSFYIFKVNLISGSVLLSVFFIEIIIIKFFLQTTSFFYTGWIGFSLKKFVLITAQFLLATNSWTLIVLTILAATYYFLFFHKNRGKIKYSKFIPDSLFLSVFVFLVIVPQLLLHQKSGFLDPTGKFSFINIERFLVPGVLGFFFMQAYILRSIAGSIKERIKKGAGREKERLVRFESAFKVIVVSIFSLVLVVNTGKVFLNALDYSRESNDVNKKLSFVKDKTDEQDPIIILYRNDPDLKIPIRLQFILSEYYERGNIYLLPLPDPPERFETVLNIYEKRITSGTRLYMNSILKHAGACKGIESLDSELNKNPLIINFNFDMEERLLMDLLKKILPDFIKLDRYKVYRNKFGNIYYHE